MAVTKKDLRLGSKVFNEVLKQKAVPAAGLGFGRSPKNLPFLLLDGDNDPSDTTVGHGLSEIKTVLDGQSKAEYDKALLDNAKLAKSLTESLVAAANRLAKGFDSTNMAACFDEKRNARH
jgi:hypothetical protein